MIKYKKMTIEKEVWESIICDVCKKEYKSNKNNMSMDDEMEIQEFHSINFTGGFRSVFGDGVAMKLDICQHCLKEKLGEYMIMDGDNSHDIRSEIKRMEEGK